MRYIFLGLALGLSACSSVNMTPPCEETSDAILRLLATDGSSKPDWVKLRSIANVQNMQEVSAGYNVRECRADISGGGVSANVHYRVEQAEGVKYYFNVELVNADEPLVGILSQSLRAEYEY